MYVFTTQYIDYPLPGYCSGISIARIFRPQPWYVPAINFDIVPSQEYHESIPSDLKPGSEVMRISASDIDDGDNRLIEYALFENAATPYFRVDPNTGIVRLERPITDVSTLCVVLDEFRFCVYLI